MVIDSNFFFLREFQPMASAPDDALYHQTKTPIGFWYRPRLNPRSLIQPSETLPIEQTGTHVIDSNLNPQLKLLFFFSQIITNNNLPFKIYCENIVVIIFIFIGMISKVEKNYTIIMMDHVTCPSFY